MKNKKGYGFRILIILELLCTIWLLLGCFQEEQLLSFYVNDNVTQELVSYKGEELFLTLGVYQVRVKSNATEGQSLYVELKSDASYFNAIKGNGVTVFPNQEYVDFEVYITDKVQNAYVQCDFYNGDAQMLTEFSVYKLNWGNRMLLFLSVILFGVLDFAIICRRKILEGKISTEQQIVFGAIALAVLFAYIPYYTDYFSLGADTAFHVLRIEGLKDSLLNGARLPVRLQSFVNYDHGSLTPVFYSDFFLYIPALFRLIGFPIMTAYKMFVFVVMLTTAIVSYKCFYHCVKERYAALFGSIFYVLAPYRLYNVYNRGAVGEYTAMIFMPLVCCGMYLLYTQAVDSPEYKRYKWWIIIGISGILQCHLLSTEMTAFVMLIVCVIYLKKTFRKETFTQLLQAVIAVVVINCWFWLPMFYMLQVNEYHIWDAYGSSIQQEGIHLLGIFQLLPFVGEELGPYKGQPINLGAAMTLMLVGYIVLRLVNRFAGWKIHDASEKHMDIQKKCDALCGIILLVLFASTRYFPWDFIEKIPGISSFVTSLEFPTRFMAPATVIASLFAVFFWKWVKELNVVSYKTVTAILSILFVVSTLYQVNSIIANSTVTRIYTAENIGSINVWNSEYLLDGTSLEDYYYHRPVATDGLQYSNYEKKGTTISMDVVNGADDVSYLELPLSAYAGYEIKAEQAAQMPYFTEETGAHADLKIAIPKGYSGSISVEYKGVWIFHIAEAISIIGILVCVVLWSKNWKGRDIFGKNK